MKTFTADVFYNCTLDDKGRHTAMVDGYTAGDPLACVARFDVTTENEFNKLDAFSIAAEKVYRQMNHVDGSEYIARMPNNRSMSVGDVVRLLADNGEETWMAVDDIGFKFIANPDNVLTRMRGERV